MLLPLASCSPTLFETPPDLGLFLVIAFISWMTFRYGVRIGKRSLSGETDYRSFLKLFALCVLGGFSALARFALIFDEWARTSEIFGGTDAFPLYWMTQRGVFWIYLTLWVSGFGVAIGYIVLNLGSIEKSRLGGALIRWRWKIGILVALVAIGLGTYKGSVRPMLNRDSLLKEFESTQGIDAYRNPLEVRLYRVHQESLYDYRHFNRWVRNEDCETLRLEREAWKEHAPNYRGFRFEKETELLAPACLKSKLDEFYVYRSRPFDTLNADYLIRFVGETSILDIWLSDNSEVDLFTNKLMSDVPDALRFSRPYLDLMERSEGGGLKYHAFGEHVLELWVNRLVRL